MGRKAASRRRNGLAHAIPPGSKNRARSPRGSPGTWEAPPSSRSIPAGGTGSPTPGPRPTHPAATGSKPGCSRDTGRAKATKRGGTGGGDSERLIVPPTRGNRPEGPRRGEGVPGHETVGGKDAGDTEPW